MSDELSLRAYLSFSKGGAEVRRSEGITVDVTGETFTHEVQSIGTAEEDIVYCADIATPGYVLIINLDATNYVEIGITTGVYPIKLKAGEFALYRHNSTAFKAKANTAACLVEFVMIET